jgi:hypothetical protein
MPESSANRLVPQVDFQQAKMAEFRRFEPLAFQSHRIYLRPLESLPLLQLCISERADDSPRLAAQFAWAFAAKAAMEVS